MNLYCMVLAYFGAESMLLKKDSMALKETIERNLMLSVVVMIIAVWDFEMSQYEFSVNLFRNVEA